MSHNVKVNVPAVFPVRRLFTWEPPQADEIRIQTFLQSRHSIVLTAVV